MNIDVLLGLQWGDEGKGKITDVLTPRYDVIARFQGGPNAGHSLEFEGSKHVLHTIPSGIFHPNRLNLIGNGVIIDPFTLKQELVKLREKGAQPEVNLKIAKRAHLILPTHRLLDKVLESAKGDAKIGSTLKGIGPAYTDKVGRNGIRIGDVRLPGFHNRYQELKEHHLKLIGALNEAGVDHTLGSHTLEEYENEWFNALDYLMDIELVDGEIYINRKLEEGSRVLGEGAQGTMLDIEFGTYPFVTSSNTITGGISSGLGVPPQKVNRVYGVFKAYCTRVGSGPFPTELFDATGDHLREKGAEFGSTTGRPRRVGWLDLPALRYAVMLNGVTHLVMMKADVLDDLDEIRICTHYNCCGQTISFPEYESMSSEIEPVYVAMPGWKTGLDTMRDYSELPKAFTDYISYIESEIGLHIAVISLGPDREQTIIRNLD